MKKKCKVNKRSVYFFASFGNFNEIPAGGGQTSARRLKDTLSRLGYSVTPINRHRPKSRYKNFAVLEILFWAVIDPIIIAFFLFFKSRNNGFVLFIGYSGPMLPMETAIGLISKVLGYKVIFFLKGGGAKYLYENGKSLYRFLFRYTINIYDEVFVEGIENGELIKKISLTPVFYMPNYTENGFAPECLPEKPNGQINLVYFGRINRDKNILFIIDVFEKLCENEKNLILSIIGASVDKYAEDVLHKINQSPFKNRIMRIEKQNHEKLKRLLKEQHIFLFPSVEKREGHSNSLNEAMAWGVVPVVSKNNFLPSIVNDDSLVAEILSVEKYVSIVRWLISDRALLKQKSQQVFMRVRNNFTQEVVEGQLKEEIDKIFYEH